LYDPLNSCSIPFFPSRAKTHHAHPHYFSRVRKYADIGNILSGKVDWVQGKEEPFTFFLMILIYSFMSYWLNGRTVVNDKLRCGREQL
jgi:hypothetical protein